MALVIALLAIGGIFGLILYAAANRNKQAASWPTVPGTVVSSQVQAIRGTESGVSYEPRVVYTYVVNGQTYTAEKLNFSAWRSTGKTEPQKVADRYPPGAEVTVHYNPKKPQDAVLEILGQT